MDGLFPCTLSAHDVLPDVCIRCVLAGFCGVSCHLNPSVCTSDVVGKGPRNAWLSWGQTIRCWGETGFVLWSLGFLGYVCLSCVSSFLRALSPPSFRVSAYASSVDGKYVSVSISSMATIEPDPFFSVPSCPATLFFLLPTHDHIVYPGEEDAHCRAFRKLPPEGRFEARTTGPSRLRWYLCLHPFRIDSVREAARETHRVSSAFLGRFRLKNTSNARPTRQLQRG